MSITILTEGRPFSFPRELAADMFEIAIARDASFPKRFGKRVHKLGGKYDEARKSWQERSVYLPWTTEGISLACQILAEYPCQESAVEFRGLPNEFVVWAKGHQGHFRVRLFGPEWEHHPDGDRAPRGKLVEPRIGPSRVDWFYLRDSDGNVKEKPVEVRTKDVFTFVEALKALYRRWREEEAPGVEDRFEKQRAKEVARLKAEGEARAALVSALRNSGCHVEAVVEQTLGHATLRVTSPHAGGTKFDVQVVYGSARLALEEEPS